MQLAPQVSPRAAHHSGHTMPTLPWPVSSRKSSVHQLTWHYQGLKEFCRGSSMSRDVLPLQQAACTGLSMTHNQHDQAQCKAADTSSHDW